MRSLPTTAGPVTAASRENVRELRGSTSVLPLADLLQMLETGRRSGALELRTPEASATLWLRDGALCDAVASDGVRGAGVVFRALDWHDAAFEVRFGPVDRPRRIAGTTSALLLEAARRADEANRGESPPPPHAALQDPPPAPPRDVLTAHRALTLLNVAAADASAWVEPSYLTRVLETEREKLATDFPALLSFQVQPSGQVALTDVPEPSLLVDATAAWLESMRHRLDASFPGRFPRQRLRQLTEAIRDDLEELGLLEALGWSEPTKEVPR